MATKGIKDYVFLRAQLYKYLQNPHKWLYKRYKLQAVTPAHIKSKVLWCT